MIQKDINNAPKANESLLYGVGYKPFAVGVLYFIIMKEIKLTRSYVVLVDDGDFKYLNQWKWAVHIVPNSSIRYAVRHGETINGKRSDILMHRLIMNTPKGFQVDHIDHNGLNNQKSNLRNCTHQQNQMNKTPVGKYLGVYNYKKTDRRNKKIYVYNHISASIRVNGKSIHLGSFKTEEDAARAYDEAAKLHFKEFANLNFKYNGT